MRTPWGPSQSQRTLGEGVVLVSTAGHGGIHLDADRNRLVHPAWREANGWYEEDCDWAIVAVTFPNLFTEEQVLDAHRSAKDWHPDAYEKVLRTTLLPTESYERRERLFFEAHASRWLATAAFGSGQSHGGRPPVPAGMVGVAARLGERGPDERWFLVPQAEYEQRRPGDFAFVVDEQRHAEWPATVAA